MLLRLDLLLTYVLVLTDDGEEMKRSLVGVFVSQSVTMITEVGFADDPSSCNPSMTARMNERILESRPASTIKVQHLRPGVWLKRVF